MSRLIQPLGEILCFVAPDGSLREIADPDGRPTGRQLEALWAAGALRITYPEPDVAPFTRAQAAWAIDHVRRTRR